MISDNQLEQHFQFVNHMLLEEVISEPLMHSALSSVAAPASYFWGGGQTPQSLSFACHLVQENGHFFLFSLKSRRANLGARQLPTPSPPLCILRQSKLPFHSRFGQSNVATCI